MRGTERLPSNRRAIALTTIDAFVRASERAAHTVPRRGFLTLIQQAARQFRAARAQRGTSAPCRSPPTAPGVPRGANASITFACSRFRNDSALSPVRVIARRILP